MKLKRFENINENTPADQGAEAAKDDAKFWADSKAYNAKLDEFVPLHSDPAVRAAVKKTTEDFKWEPDEIIAMCYGMLVEINEHDMAKEFVELAKKHH